MDDTLRIVAGEHCGRQLDTTNNQMELVAVREAIRLGPAGISLDVMTDSRIGYKRKHPAVIRL
jgi:ribonuclease HI